ncbi:amidohydrolase family protein [Sulfolobus sp. E11-6]|uniref:amidohydrolase family protein n=1 Tax=Sulfolobus sp. E11-6 TaxID=2663020 RepID=UPI001297F5A8|nr:amidohydrolase family protein [Sulfolobus sp. E11-6]QGA69019.1 amidohydrolase family protein [Sulfolobus sp. E11-6]
MLSKPDELKDTIIVDAEAHLMESPEEYQEYLEKPYRTPMIVKDVVTNTRYLVIDGKLVPRPFGFGGGMILGNIDHARNPYWGQTNSKLKAKGFSLDDIEGRLMDMDQMGVDIQIAACTNCLSIPNIKDRNYAYALAKAYNNYVHDKLRKIESRRLLVSAIVPLQDVDLAIKELERVKELGFKSVVIPPYVSNGTYIASKPIWEEEFFKFFEKVAQLDMILIIHPTGATNESPFAFQFYNWYYVRSIAFPFSNMATLTGLIGEGIFERLSKLKVCLAESGGSWLPYWIWWLDETIEHGALRKYFKDRFGIDPYPNLKKLASEYLQQGNIYVSLESDEPPELVRYLVEKLGMENNLLFGTDYPHVSDIEYFPDEVSVFIENVAKPANLTLNQIRKILGDNAVELFNLR